MYPQWFAISSFLSGFLSFQLKQHSMQVLFKGGPSMTTWNASLYEEIRYEPQQPY